MCLLVALTRVLPGCPLLLLATREEDYDRDSIRPTLMQCKSGRPAWLGGQDQRAGGTWLGVNERGLVVAVTNRPAEVFPSNPRSRGLLCRDLLSCESASAASAEAVQRLASDCYADCNLIVFDRISAALVEVERESKHPLSVQVIPHGLFAIGNGPANDPNDLRSQRAREEFKQIERDSSIDHWIQEIIAFAGMHDDEQPTTSMCQHGADRGTVSASIIALTDDPQRVRYLYADGPPCRVPFDDYSTDLRTLLAR